MAPNFLVGVQYPHTPCNWSVKRESVGKARLPSIKAVSITGLLGKQCNLNLLSGNPFVFSDDHINLQLGKLILLKIKSILDITELKKIWLAIKPFVWAES